MQAAAFPAFVPAPPLAWKGPAPLGGKTAHLEKKESRFKEFDKIKTGCQAIPTTYERPDNEGEKGIKVVTLRGSAKLQSAVLNTQSRLNEKLADEDAKKAIRESTLRSRKGSKEGTSKKGEEKGGERKHKSKRASRRALRHRNNGCCAASAKKLISVGRARQIESKKDKRVGP